MSKIMKKIFSVRNEGKHKVFRILGIKISMRGKAKTGNVSRFTAPIGLVNYEIVHIVHEADLSVDLVKFLNSFVDHSKHLFIFKSGINDQKNRLEDDNIIYGNLFTLRIDLRKTKKIIMHSMLQAQDVAFLYKFPQLLKVTYWAIWGKDLSQYTQTDKTEFVKFNVKAILTASGPSEYERRFGEKLSFDVAYMNSKIDKDDIKRLWCNVFDYED